MKYIKYNKNIWKISMIVMDKYFEIFLLNIIYQAVEKLYPLHQGYYLFPGQYNGGRWIEM